MHIGADAKTKEPEVFVDTGRTLAQISSAAMPLYENDETYERVAAYLQWTARGMAGSSVTILDRFMGRPNAPTDPSENDRTALLTAVRVSSSFTTRLT